MIQPLWNADPVVWHWLKMTSGQHIEPATCMLMGVVKDDDIIGAVLYHRFRWPDIEMGIYTTDKSWCTRNILKSMFSYPFFQLGCARVTAVTDPSKPEVCKFIERLGFVREGRLRNALPHGDQIIFGMTRDECRWI